MGKILYRFESGKIKIPHPINICFEDSGAGVAGVVVDMAQDIGALQAENEQLKQSNAAQQEEITSLKNELESTRETVRYNDQWITDRFFALEERVSGIDDRVTILEASEGEGGNEGAGEGGNEGAGEGGNEGAGEGEQTTTMQGGDTDEEKPPKRGNSWRIIF